MKIYSGQTSDKIRMGKLKKYNMGVMISTHPSTSFASGFLKNCDVEYMALDNGMYSNWKNGINVFNIHPFLETINLILKFKLWDKLDFIVCPDLPARGLESLEFSMKWEQQLSCDKLYLAIQDGMTVADIEPYMDKFSGIFLGGTLEWKFSIMKEFSAFAKRIGKPIHAGRIGTLPRLQYCDEQQIDSVDSTNFVRNNTWFPIQEFLNPTQEEMF